jgi:para-aminobenzoate synthetase/4-amino-4-deoxychorismate lyase
VPLSYVCGAFRIYPSLEEHRQAVHQTVEYIRDGGIFQANICLRLAADFDGEPLDAFCAAATRLDPPYAAFLHLDNGAMASLSPELFLRRDGSRSGRRRSRALVPALPTTPKPRADPARNWRTQPRTEPRT